MAGAVCIIFLLNFFFCEFLELKKFVKIELQKFKNWSSIFVSKKIERDTLTNMFCGPIGGKVFTVRKEHYKGKREGYD
jgi:hypothetical protein